MKRKTPLQRHRPMRRISPRRQASLLDYNKVAKRYLAAIPTCQVCLSAPTCQIHHRAGRLGPRLADTKGFLAVCDNCHRWIHDNPRIALARGFTLKRS